MLAFLRRKTVETFDESNRVFCRKCGHYVSPNDFHNNASRENGLQYYCKKHQIEFVQNYYWRNYNKCRFKSSLRNKLKSGKISYRQYEKEMIKAERM